jgi:hypothetical protein
MDKRLAITAMLMLVVPALCAADSGWVTVTPDNGGFSAKFPVTPEPQLQSQKDVDTNIWLGKSTDGNVMVLVGVTDYWAHIDTDQELTLDQTNFLSSVGGTASSSKRDTFRRAKPRAKLPAEVFEFSTTSGWNGRSRVIVDGDTVYQTAVMWKQGYDASAVLDLFESSFKLLPRTRPAPSATAAGTQ